mmetsp:Transcript_22787/g.52058  ORF Transcript_22787/g.52058 Transcript_22787/m.52058 type:complete len:625 (-) Transcript_22787:118-1992(-)
MEELSTDEVHLGFDCLCSLSPEVSGLVLSFLSAPELAVAEASLPEWHKTVLSKQRWWSERCLAEFGARPHAANLWSTCWRRKYQQLYGAAHPTHGTWCYYSETHGLDDRVAQPQLFLGPEGRKMFCYGGWTDSGPENDLHCVSIEDVCRRCLRNDGATTTLEAHGDQEEAESAGFRFEYVEMQGRPCRRAGVQTLTPLWFGTEAPTAKHISETYANFVCQGSLTKGRKPESQNMAMVLAFGGAQGGYRSEHNHYAVGLLTECQHDGTSSIVWGRPKESPDSDTPTPRAAHTATYVPGRFLPPGEYPEGAVVVFGGHTEDTEVELSSIELLRIHNWSWYKLQPRGVAPRARHGHTATLVEVDGRGYILFIGGGTGNILGSSGDRDTEEFGDVAILDCYSWSWLGPLHMSWIVEQSDRPTLGRHHTACAGLGGQVLLYGGGRQPQSKHVRTLDGRQCVEAAKAGQESVTVREVACHERSDEDEQWKSATKLPECRKMHGAVSLLPFAPCLVIYGGWFTGSHFSDLWILGLGGSKHQLSSFAAPKLPSRSRPDARFDFPAGLHGGGLRDQLVMMMLARFREQRAAAEEAEDNDEDEEGEEFESAGEAGHDADSDSSEWQVPCEYSPL